MAVVLYTILFFGGGFFVMGGLLHWWYYGRQRERPEAWKHQPKKFPSRKSMVEKLPLVLTNSLIINTIIGVALSFSFEGLTPAYWSTESYGVTAALVSTVGLFFWYHFTLYYFHKAMHRPALLRAIHHYHHKYKTPMFLDALYEHPIEAVWGGIVISAPLYLFPIWLPGFFFYLAMVGVHELIDHSGVNLNVPLLSRSLGHDDHHLRFNCYYGQLLGLLDWFHGTDDRHYRKSSAKAKASAAVIDTPPA